MTLQQKIFSILIILLVLMSATDYLIDKHLIFHNYIALEQDQVKKDLKRCVAALKVEIDHLNTVADDWAIWDDSYQFLQDHNADYIESNLVPLTFTDNNLNLIHYYDLKGALVWGKAMNLDTQATILISPLDTQHLSPDHPLLKRAEVRSGTQSGVCGLFMTSKGPMLICSKPVLTSEQKGPTRGFLMMGRMLSPKLMSQLVRQTQVDHNIWPLDDDSLKDEDRHAISQITQEAPFYIRDAGGLLHGYTIVPDLLGNPGLLIRTAVQKEITQKGQSSIHYGIISNVLMSLSFLLVLLGLLKYTVLQPILSLTRHAVAIRDKNDLSLRQNNRHPDEIGVLSREFDRLVAQQQSVQKGLQAEIEERHLYEKKLNSYHQKLRQLSSELLLTEERERRKIAVDLHDHIGQSLAMSKMKIDALIATLSPSDVSKTLEQISRLIEKTIQDTRTLTFELSPPLLYEFGLSTALKWLCDKFTQQYELDIQFNANEATVPMDTSLRIMLFQITRELLFNIVKHSQSRKAVLSMAIQDSRVEITVEDNGKGFDPAILGTHADHDIGFGLFNIRERMEHIGGQFEINSAPGKGTHIRLVSPIKSPAPDEQGRTAP